jgi:hypothetical protein
MLKKCWRRHRNWADVISPQRFAAVISGFFPVAGGFIVIFRGTKSVIYRFTSLNRHRSDHKKCRSKAAFGGMFPPIKRFNAFERQLVPR